MIHTEKNKHQEPTQIRISKTPAKFDLNAIEIDINQCFANSWRLAEKYPNVIIVEGLIIAIDNENEAKPMPHAWNNYEDIHFDITNEKIWKGTEEMEETKEIKYFPVKFHKHSDFENGDIFEFSSKTMENVDAIKDFLKQHETKK